MKKKIIIIIIAIFIVVAMIIGTTKVVSATAELEEDAVECAMPAHAEKVETTDIDELKSLISIYKSRQEAAHAMAESARFLGFSEESYIIDAATEEWFYANDMITYYQEIYDTEYAKIKEAEEKARQEELAKQQAAQSTQTAGGSAIVVSESSNGVYYSPKQFKRDGVIRYNGKKWTWYSQKVLPGGGLNIPGRHVDDGGYVCDGSGYIVLASCDYAKGTVLSTPLGKNGIVYDVCPSSGIVDVYVSW